MQLFDGKKHAEILDQRITSYLKNSPINKKLAIVLIGDDAASLRFVNLKDNLCNKLGIKTEIVKLSSLFSDTILTEKVREVFSDKTVGGGIIQLPLPRQSLYSILELIPEEKDIDLISNKMTEMFYGNKTNKMSPVVRAFHYFLEQENIPLKGLKVTILGEGNLVGKPLKHYLLKNGAKVNILSDYKKGTKIDSQLVVLSAGVPCLVSPKDLKNNCHVMDFGSSIVEGRTVGDLSTASDWSKLGIISPSPGGMGPLVIRFLILNFLGL